MATSSSNPFSISVISSYEFPPGPLNPSSQSLIVVPTFENVGLCWKEPAGGEALVRFRKLGEAAWRQGLSLWFDDRNNPYNNNARTGDRSLEHRGSLVGLEPGTTYEVEVLTSTTRMLASATVTTWSESFPIAQIIQVTNRTTPWSSTRGAPPPPATSCTSPPQAPR